MRPVSLHSSTSYAQSYLDQRRKRRRQLLLALLYLLAVAAYALFFVFWQAEPVPAHVHAVAVLVAATCLLPLWHWYGGDRQRLPLFELIVFSHGIQYSMPVFTQPNQVLTTFNGLVSLSWESVFQALLYAEFGIIALLIGYYMVRNNGLARSLPRLDLPLDSQQRSTYLKGALIIGGTVGFIQALGLLRITLLGSILRVIANQMNVAIVILGYVVYRGDTQRNSFWLYAAVTLAFLTGLISGFLEAAFIPLVLVLLVRWHVRREFPWRAVAAASVLFLLLNPAKFDYRRQVWYGGRRDLAQRLTVWVDAVGDNLDTLLDPSRREEEEPVGSVLTRFDQIHKFAYIREVTPAYIPHLNGQTYTYFLYAWIPRVIWSSKPVASAGMSQMDVRYGFRYEWQNSSIGVGQLPEAYVNFGALGVLLMMILQGVIFAVLDVVLNGPHSDGGRAIYLTVMVYFLNGIGASTAVLFGALFQNVIANALILRPFAHDFQAEKSEATHYSSLPAQE